MQAKPNMQQVTQKAHVSRGFYTATLIRVDESVRPNKFGGTQFVVQFEIAGAQKKISTFLPWEYKLDDGTLVTALTPKSMLTRCFMSLGYTYGEVLEPTQYIGRQCEVLIDDAKNLQEYIGERGVLVKSAYSVIKEFRPLVQEQLVR